MYAAPRPSRSYHHLASRNREFTSSAGSLGTTIWVDVVFYCRCRKSVFAWSRLWWTCGGICLNVLVRCDAFSFAFSFWPSAFLACAFSHSLDLCLGLACRQPFLSRVPLYGARAFPHMLYLRLLCMQFAFACVAFASVVRRWTSWVILGVIQDCEPCPHFAALGLCLPRLSSLVAFLACHFFACFCLHVASHVFTIFFLFWSKIYMYIYIYVIWLKSIHLILYNQISLKWHWNLLKNISVYVRTSSLKTQVSKSKKSLRSRKNFT